MSKSRSPKGRPMATRTERRRAALERRRAASRRGIVAQVAARRRRTRIRWAVAGAAAAVLVVAGVVFVVTRDSGGPAHVSLTGEQVDAEGALGITTTPTSYSVTYAFTAYSGGVETTEGTESVRVSRPFASDLAYSYTSTDGTSATSQFVNVLGLTSSTTSSSDPSVLPQPPAGALGDIRLDATLDDLVAGGQFELRERRRVLDRECQVYRTGSDVQSYAVTAPTDDTYTDACIDASGLLLEEVVYEGGLPSSHFVATAVNEDPVDDIAVDGEPTDTTTTLTEIDADTAPVEGYWAFPTAPEGFEHVGRYAYSVPGDPDAVTTTETTVPVDSTDTTAVTDSTAAADSSAVPTDGTASPTSVVVEATSGNVIASTDTTAVTDTAATDTAATETTVAGTATDAAATTIAPTDDTATADTAPAGDGTTEDDAAADVPPVVTYVDVYSNGADFLIVQQGPTSQQSAPTGVTSSATVGPLGTVTQGSSTFGSSITGNPESPVDWFVTIDASVDLSTLGTIAATIAQA